MALPPLPEPRTDADWKLKVENRRRNVFVTQLEEPRDGADELVKLIPVITQSSSEILETGVRTLQSTLVLKKQQEVEELNTHLTHTRQHIQRSMRSLQERRAQLQSRQAESKLRAERFQRFVEENELKRRRALKKLQTERQQQQEKDTEERELRGHLEELQQRRLRLKERVEKYKMFEEFLMKTLDVLPDSYLRYGTDLVTPIIRRYETLSLSRRELLEQLQQRTDQMKSSQSTLDTLRLQHNTHRLMRNQDLSELQAQLDQMKEKNKQLEATLHMQQGRSRQQVEQAGLALMAVRNLAQQCHLTHYGPLDAMDTPTMMDMIKEFMVEQADLQRRALRLRSSTASHSRA